MTEKLLSVLIPIYNDEKYLSQTLDSVLSAVSEENRSLVEYIFIDDGSTDKTPDILEDYNKKFEITVAHQENKGAFSTTKTLIEMSTGKYFVTVDHDDLLEINALDKIICYLQQHPEVDLLIFDHYNFGSNCATIPYSDGCQFKYSDGQNVFVELLKKKKYSDPLWNRVMHRKTILENNVFSGHPYELDVLVSPKIYSVVKNVGYLPEILYAHRLHKDSLSHSVQQRQWITRCHLYALNVLHELIRNNGLSKAFCKAVCTKITDLYFGAIASAWSEEEQGIDKTLIRELKTYSWAMKYGKWNRKYIYRPLIQIIGIERFFTLRYSKRYRSDNLC